jgi:CRP/FNR family transcriptional regulator
LAHAAKPVLHQSCVGCTARGEHAFCNLPQDTLGELERLSFTVGYPEQTILFSEAETCKGVFVVCSGKVKLSTRGQDGKELMLRAAMPGDILGLSEALSGATYEVSARTLAPSYIRFVKREDFLNFLRVSTISAFQAMMALSNEYDAVFESLRSIALSHTATARIAQLLLRMSGGAGANNIRMLLTQEQIAQMTGTTRETVTRFFTQMRRNRVISLRGSNLRIMDRIALERIAA